jgi:hypothetical protein
MRARAAYRASMVIRIASIVVVASAACAETGAVEPRGAHHHYIVDRIHLPLDPCAALDDALDLDGDGRADNELGLALAALGGNGVAFQQSIDASIADGSTTILVDLQADDLVDAPATGLTLAWGRRYDLDGTAAYATDSSAPANPPFVGAIETGTFRGAAGAMSIPFSFGGATTFALDLIGARVVATQLATSAIGGESAGGAIVAGAISIDDLDGVLVPALQRAIVPIVERDCCGAATSPGSATCDASATPACGCIAGSFGETILQVIDASPRDCTVSVAEIANNSLMQSVLAPDVSIGGRPAISFGVRVSAVAASFP